MHDAASTPPKLLLLDVPGADWRLIGPLLDAGHLPHLDALISRGTVANLSGATPQRMPVTSIAVATGVRASDHGIFGPVLSDNGHVRPVFSPDVKAAALWDHVRASGGRAASIGWPASYPVSQDAQLAISDVFALSRGKDFESWPVDPVSLSSDLPVDVMHDLRLHQREVSAQMLLPFVEVPSNIDLETDERMGLLATTLARTSTLHGVATWIAETQPWDCLAVHFDFVERLTTAFLPYMAPQMPHVTDADFSIYQNVVTGAYRFLDLLLQRYGELVDEDCTIMLTSGHGYHLGAMRPPPAPKGQAFASSLYRSLGVLAAAGPSIKRDELVFGPMVHDIVPTALAVLGLPRPKMLAGRVIADIFTDVPTRLSDADMPVSTAPKTADIEPALAQHRLSELAQLGYISKLPEDSEAACEMVDIHWHLARADFYMGLAQHEAALTALGGVLALSPDHFGALIQSARCQLALGKTSLARTALEDLEASGGDSALTQYLWGTLALQEKDHSEAAAAFERAETKLEARPNALRLLDSIARGWLSLKDAARAVAVFEKARAIDGDDPLVNGGFGLALFSLGQYGEAVEPLKQSLGGLQNQPLIHSYLGQCYFKLGRSEDAASAYQAALAIAPNFKMAQQGLAQLGHTIAKSAFQNTAGQTKAGEA